MADQPHSSSGVAANAPPSPDQQSVEEMLNEYKTVRAIDTAENIVPWVLGAGFVWYIWYLSQK